MSVDWTDFCAWLGFKLQGKKPDGSALGSIVVLVDDAHEIRRRLVISFARDRVELLHDKSGDPKLPKLVIRGRFEDLIDYLRTPSRARVEALTMFGDWRLMKTLADLLTQRRSLLDIRAGG